MSVVKEIFLAFHGGAKLSCSFLAGNPLAFRPRPTLKNFGSSVFFMKTSSISLIKMRESIKLHGRSIDLSPINSV